LVKAIDLKTAVASKYVTFDDDDEPVSADVFDDLTTTDGTTGSAQLVCGENGYGGITIKLIDQLDGLTFGTDYDLIKFVVECYSDTAGDTPITTGTNLFTATLFRPFDGTLANGGFGGDSGRGFPAWAAAANPDGRQQGIGAGVNAHAPNGLTTELTSTKAPEAIRFERGGPDSALKSLKIVSIEFLKK